MSLLNLTSDGLPNILVALYATIAKAIKPMSRNQVLDAIAPNGVVENSRLARSTLNRWAELGLFHISEESDEVTLNVRPSFELKSDLDIIRATRIAARRVALSRENNMDIWARENSRAADLTRSLAWLLAQDVYSLQFRDVQNLELAQVLDTELRLMQNATRINGLQFWGHFLGFIRQPGGGDVDPTQAVRDVLPDCIGNGEEMPAADFIERLRATLPVIDGGDYSLAVLGQIDQSLLPRLPTGQLSTSLSRALFGLLFEQALLFEDRSDVGTSITLTGRDGPRLDHRYTWVRRPKGSS